MTEMTSAHLYRWCLRFRELNEGFLQTNQSWKFSFLPSVCRSPQSCFPSQWKPTRQHRWILKDGTFLQQAAPCNLGNGYTGTIKVIYQKSSKAQIFSVFCSNCKKKKRLQIFKFQTLLKNFFNFSNGKTFVCYHFIISNISHVDVQWKIQKSVFSNFC
jgi:hypothetical protein